MAQDSLTERGAGRRLTIEALDDVLHYKTLYCGIFCKQLPAVIAGTELSRAHPCLAGSVRDEAWLRIAVVPRYFGRIGAATVERYILRPIGVRPFRCVNCNASERPNEPVLQSLEKNLITGPASNLNFSTSGTEP